MSTDAKFSSRIYSMGHGAFIRRLASMHATPWLWGCGVLAAGSLSMAIAIDLRWLVVLFAVICVAIPMLMVFLYIFHGLRRECFVNIVPHSLHISPGDDELTVVLYRREEESVDPEEMDDSRIHEPEETGTGQKKDVVKPERGKSVLRESGRFRFPLSEIRPCDVGMNSVTIPVGRGFIWIPSSAWPDGTLLSAFIEILYQSAHSECQCGGDMRK